VPRKSKHAAWVGGSGAPRVAEKRTPRPVFPASAKPAPNDHSAPTR
jgi:hypothetical protein